MLDLILVRCLWHDAFLVHCVPLHASFSPCGGRFYRAKSQSPSPDCSIQVRAALSVCMHSGAKATSCCRTHLATLGRTLACVARPVHRCGLFGRMADLVSTSLICDFRASRLDVGEASTTVLAAPHADQTAHSFHQLTAIGRRIRPGASMT